MGQVQQRVNGEDRSPPREPVSEQDVRDALYELATLRAVILEVTDRLAVVHRTLSEWRPKPSVMDAAFRSKLGPMAAKIYTLLSEHRGVHGYDSLVSALYDHPEDRAWRHDGYPKDERRALSVHVCLLRRHLKPRGEGIRTHHGIGYELVKLKDRRTR